MFDLLKYNLKSRRIILFKILTKKNEGVFVLLYFVKINELLYFVRGVQLVWFGLVVVISVLFWSIIVIVVLWWYWGFCQLFPLLMVSIKRVRSAQHKMFDLLKYNLKSRRIILFKILTKKITVVLINPIDSETPFFITVIFKYISIARSLKFLKITF